MNRQANITNKEKQIYKNGQASVQRPWPVVFPGQACKTAQGFLESALKIFFTWAPKNTLTLRLSFGHLVAGTELRGGGPQPGRF